MNNIYIVGFMGTGKTAVGKVLAKRMGLKFIDLDDRIEETQGSKIADIFAKKGEAYFREAEAKALQDIAAQTGLVAACGGGIVLNKNNIETMDNSGDIFCLDASVEVIYERIKNASHRPLLNVEDPKGKIEELLDRRARFYTKIEHHIDTSDFTIDEVVQRIIDKTQQSHD